MKYNNLGKYKLFHWLNGMNLNQMNCVHILYLFQASNLECFFFFISALCFNISCYSFVNIVELGAKNACDWIKFASDFESIDLMDSKYRMGCMLFMLHALDTCFLRAFDQPKKKINQQPNLKITKTKILRIF